MPLAVVGACVSIYHIVVERFPSLETACDVSNPCSIIWVERFGYLTIPAMALSGFAAIVALLLVPRTVMSSQSSRSSTSSKGTHAQAPDGQGNRPRPGAAGGPAGQPSGRAGGNRTRTLVIAGAVAALVVVALLVAVLAGGDDGGARPPRAATPR